VPDTSPPTEPQADEVATDEEVFADLEHEAVASRLWIRALTPLLQLRSHETDPSSRVQFAFDQMYVAACERIARILRSDLTGK
jgi:hypothetical protein